MSTPNMDTHEAEGWRPEPGDMLVGTLEDVDMGWSDFRGEYPILTIRAAEGTKSANVNPGEHVKVHCFHDVLFSRIVTLRPIPGETVGIQFHGKQQHKSKPQQTVSRYTFKVAGRTADAGGLYDRLGAGRVRQQPQQQQSAPPMDARDFEPLPPGTLSSPAGPTADDDEIPF